MSLSIGIVGLPNVGKSTLFNALIRSKMALAANYPFATVDPNIGIVEVPDSRMAQLASVENPQKMLPAVVEFHDIAGLVKGASTGEGLGNQFLTNIRECDAIAHVVRAFSDDNVIHVHGSVDPKEDIDVIHTELLLADMQTLDKRLARARNDVKSNKPGSQKPLEFFERVSAAFGAGTLAINVEMSEEEMLLIKDLHLLTAKPILYVANVDDAHLATFDTQKAIADWGLPANSTVTPICAKIEEELIGMSPEDLEIFMKDLGIDDSGINKMIRQAYKTLNLITYFTSGPKEVHAWTIERGTMAPQAAGVIHTDFEKGFIRAEVIAFDDYIAAGGEAGAKEKGKMRLEGKDYVVQDGDVMHFRFAN
jgi:GTP-binding protein YchF